MSVDRVVLVGAEDVARASCDMREAGRSMERAAQSLAEELHRHRQWAEDWLMRLEAAREALDQPNVTPPKPAFNGEPEPITSSVLASIGLRPSEHDGDYWHSNTVSQDPMFVRTGDGLSGRMYFDLYDARKLQAIMEILQA